MRINLTKKDLVNLIYMQLGFSKQISENLIEDFLTTIISNIKDEKRLNKIFKMRINLTKKDLVNLIYMQLGFSKQISENLIDDFLSTIASNIKDEKKLKLSKFGTFSIRQKKSRIGRNPKTKETKVISSREVVLFKPSKEFKEFVNSKDNG